MRTAGAGIVLGLGGSVALTRYLQSLLFGVGAHDLSVYAGVTALLLGFASVMGRDFIIEVLEQACRPGRREAVDRVVARFPALAAPVQVVDGVA